MFQLLGSQRTEASLDSFFKGIPIWITFNINR